jgi:integrase
MYRERSYSSPLAPYIEGLLGMKRACGYSYELEAYVLAGFDSFCIDRGLEDAAITRELVAAWAERRPTEGKGYRSQRVSFVRQLSLFMRGQGAEAYVPHHFSSQEKSIPYIPSPGDVIGLFGAIDSYLPKRGACAWMSGEYRIAFRLMYCCGMRIAECSSLRRADVDLDGGSMTIRHSKGDRDRIVYMPDGLAGMCEEYWRCVVAALGFCPEWFFPGRFGDKPIAKTTFDMKFRQFWSMVPGTGQHSKRPTPHALRHAFVVARMNAWMEEGADLDVMMPYLSSYLGHRGASETFYYYHQVSDAFGIVRARDKVSGRVIPEVVFDAQ